jgi:hypothetical protein
MPQTGPKSQRGKAVSSRNAEKHGLLSNTPVLDIEDPADWDEHLRGILESLEPEGYLETVLAHRIATQLWRIARVIRYETEMISLDIDYDDEHEALQILTGKAFDKQTLKFRIPERERRIHINARLIPGEMSGPKIMRYEAHLHREWLQIQHELEAMQTKRHGGATPLARLDITGAPGG